MTLDGHRLARHLLIAVLVKMAALMALWWWWVRDNGVAVDAERVASQMLLPAARSTMRQGNPR